MKFKIFRPRHSDLSDQLKDAIRSFHGDKGRLPEQVVVAPSILERAKETMNQLELATIPVASTGGCLAGEVWLGYQQEAE
jgi:hypothetical protein